MNLKSLFLKKSYSSDYDDILNDFYIPVLAKSCEYQRLAGYFSSTSLSVAARGLSDFIRNGGKMKLIVSPRLNEDDIDVILNSQIDSKQIIENNFIKELDSIDDELIRDHVSALGWMIANGTLNIKVVIPINTKNRDLIMERFSSQTGIFHQKVGILKDKDGNTISFSGSINESALGWLGNIEEFKVFRGWISEENQYVETDIVKFERFWNDKSWRVRVIDIPRAVEEKLIEYAPNDFNNLDLEKYNKSFRVKKMQLYSHQKKAVDSWLNNNMRGIFEMATGTGKTFAAIGCIDQLSQINKELLVVITCPYKHLVQQWRREIIRFGLNFDKIIVADSSNNRWRDNLVNALIEISLGQKQLIIVLTTHSTFPSKDLLDIVQENKKNNKIFLIADEVHGLGANKSKKGLSNNYDYRLGLSATPRRWFDDEGTKAIYDFFEKNVFEFDLKNAINTINPATGDTFLVPYRYIPKFVFLSSEEMNDYIEKTKRIARMSHIDEKGIKKNEIMKLLLIARANIIKNANQKYMILGNILDEKNIQKNWMIIYCSPQQINNVMNIVNKRRIIAHKFTMQEGTTPQKKYNNDTERDYLLTKFAEGTYQCLVAMKCLDQGVDVPPARTAILMASSGNPLEYIQRIGRVLRRFEGKTEATIIDIIVLPSLMDVPSELRGLEDNILKKEFQRYEEIAQNALNNAEAYSIISKAYAKLRE